MADYLFVPQSVLDRWSEKGKVSVEGHVLTLMDGSISEKPGEKQVFALTEAVRFLKMEAGDDILGLLQKVKTLEALKQMGAEHLSESVLIGDAAYQVQQGFLADAHAIRQALEGAADLNHAKAQPAPTAKAAPATAATAAKQPPSPEVNSSTPAASAGKTPPPSPAVLPAPMAKAARASSPGAAKPGASGGNTSVDKGKSGESDMLAQFFLDNLQ